MSMTCLSKDVAPYLVTEESAGRAYVWKRRKMCVWKRREDMCVEEEGGYVCGRGGSMCVWKKRKDVCVEECGVKEVESCRVRRGFKYPRMSLPARNGRQGNAEGMNS